MNVLKGTIPDFVFASLVDFFPISEGKEILTFSSTHRDLSIYNIETGEEVCLQDLSVQRATRNIAIKHAHMMMMQF